MASLRVFATAFDAAVLVLTIGALAGIRQYFHDWWPYDLFPGDTPVLADFEAMAHAPLLVLVLPIWLGALRSLGHYRAEGLLRQRRLFSRTLRGVGLATLCFLSVLWALGIGAEFSRTMLVAFALMTLPVLVTGRLLFRALATKPHHTWNAPVHVLLVGSAAAARPLLDAISRHPEWGLKVIGAVGPEPPPDDSNATPWLGALSQLSEALESYTIDRVLLTAGPWPSEMVQSVADTCDEVGVRLSMDANALGLRLASAEVETFEGFSVLSFSSRAVYPEALAVKRIIDVVGALSLGLVSLPLLVVAGLAVKLHDGGPALFAQERSGRNGRRFRMYKLRTMDVDAEERLADVASLNEMDGPVFKASTDPRVTTWGRWLRRTSIDELPQLWNVLRGEMSLVGPRPPIPREVAQYERWQMRRLSMRPGLTCSWQVSGRSDVDFDQWMRLDLDYIDNWSLGMDLKLLAQTVPVVLFGVGAR
jgi:exopolysaccharide biosynthesis polyprenyl glycosylphosphotransferase